MKKMKTNILVRMHTQKTIILYCLLALSTSLFAQQLPDSSFENWGNSFNGDPQLVNWNGSNVTQVGFNFTFMYRDAGRISGYCARVADKEVGAAGITEPAPGYMSLGQPWSYLESLTKISEATAGTDGGINFTYRPDTMAIWIKRTGNNTDKEYYHLLFYSWKGQSVGESYTGKNGSCTSTTHINEESDIRQVMNGNVCSTKSYATQVAEGWVKERKTYDSWTLIKVPIYYMNDNVPEKCNVILSAGNYPNFRANSGLYPGNTLYVDDLQLIYSSAIGDLYVNNKKWLGFDPNLRNGEEQTYALGLGVTTVPTVSAKRGAGSLTNCRGTSASFAGRTLSGNEITITNATEVGGTSGNNITTIVVRAEDGSSTSTYKIKFVAEQSTNSRPANITYTVDGETFSLPNFSGYVTNYNVELPFGTTSIPTIEAVKGDDGQEFVYTQATTIPGTATLKSTAADKNYSSTYVINFSVGQLDDNKLADIKIDGNSLPGFSPTKTTYTVELPLGTTALPTIEPISAYAQGAQTITVENNVTISGETCIGTYNISVKAPGNVTTRVYRLSFKITASTYSYLKDIKVGGVSIEGFDPMLFNYSYALPQGTTVLPSVEAVKGDAYQQTPVIETGGVDGVTKITVTAASGAQSIYRITFSVPKSSNASLSDLRVNGTTIPNFDPNTLVYNYEFPIGTTTAPVVTYTAGDEYQIITKMDGGLNGTTRIIVQAQNGSVKTYVINFSVARADNTTLLDIKVGGVSIPNFDPNVYTYTYKLARGTTVLPEITYTAHDEYQTITVRNGGIEGGVKIIVKSQVGTSATYVITFSIEVSSNADLQQIFIGGNALNGFNANVFNYTYELPIGTTTLPAVTWTAGDAYQTITKTDGGLNGTTTIVVRSEDGTKTNTYRITFTVAQADNVTLNDILVGGVSIPNFHPNTFEYSILLERGTTVLPAITYVLYDAWQKVRVVSAGVSGDTRIIVTAQTGATATYIIHFSVEKSANSRLAGISIGGVALENFDPEVLTYDYTLKSGTAILPEIGYTKSDDAQKVLVVKGGINGTTTLRVIAENGDETLYTINFSVEKSENAFLKNIFIDDVPLANFDKSTFYYVYRLQPTATVCPKITVEKDLGQSVSISKPLLTGEVRIVVTPESGGSNTYIIKMMFDLSDNTALADLRVAGTTILGFSPEKLEYTYELPIGTTVLPTITYTAAEIDQKVSVTKGDTSYVRVEAADGSEALYTIYFIIPKSNNVQLAGLMIGGVALANFDANVTEYDYELVRGTTVCPTIEAVKGDVMQNVSVLSPMLEGVGKIIVVAETGITNIYTINFHFNKSNISTLAALKVGGSDILQSEQLEYNYILPKGTVVLPTIVAEKGDEYQTVTVLSNGVNGQTSVVVKAENGTVTTYTINFSVAPSSDVQLLSLKLDGVELSGFSPEILDYVDTLAYGVKTAPIVTAFGSDPAQQIIIADAPAVEGTATIKVIAEDGNTATYSVKFVRAKQSNASLKAIAADGLDLTDFSSEKTDYIIDIEADAAAPKITYEKYDTTQIVAVADAGLKGVKIVVTAQNGNQRTYTVRFNVLPSSNALLADLKMFNGNEFVSLNNFDANTFTYVDTLQWRTKNVPSIHPVPAQNEQTITIKYGAINDTTLIRVVAQDGVTTTDYSVYFPVLKSSVATLGDISIDDAELSPAFTPTEFNYVATLAYGTSSVPTIRWAQGEDFGKQLVEQQVTIFAPSLRDTAHIVVTAEDGSQKTYNITFTVRESGKSNVLQSIFIDKYHFDCTQQRDFAIELPYGATTMSAITVIKNYPEQTVLIDNGGAYAPTTITVKANQAGVADAIYTITPTIAKSQAVLDSIKVNGLPIADFNPYKFQYVVSVNNGEGELPTLEYVNNTTTSSVEEMINGTKFCTIQVVGKDDGTENTYKIIYYYANDVLPNGEFTEWTNAAIYTAAKKPTGWSMIADAVDKTDIKSNATIFGLPIGSLITVGTYTPNEAVTQSGNIVRLRTIYNSALKSSIPGLITLGEMTAKLAQEASVTDVTGGILFRNTPDKVSMRYQPVSKSNVSSTHFVYSLNNGAYKKEVFDNNFNNTWKTMELPLLDNTVDAPSMMNIIINSCEKENTSTLAQNAASEMNVDWIRFAYNSKISKILVNGKATTGFKGKYDGGWVQAVKVDAELQGEPILSFIGEVDDQEYTYRYDAEVENCSGSKTRVAYITSKAEDGTLSQYVVNINRPFSANSGLKTIVVNGDTVQGFAPATTTYTVEIPNSTRFAPDVMAVRGNMHQTIVCDTLSTKKAVFTVTAENGTQTIYTLNFVEAKNDDTSLKKISVDGITDFIFAADTINYVVQLAAETALPNVFFEKRSDGQTVTMAVDTITTLLVVAENGTNQKTYTIKFEFGATATTSGKLVEIKVDGIPVASFDKDLFYYESNKKAAVDFVREFAKDRVEQFITNDSIVWNVYGSEQHNYCLKFIKELSDNVYLQTLLVDNDTLDNFTIYENNYELTTLSVSEVQAIYAEEGQMMDVRFDKSVADNDYLGFFTFTITAANGTKDSTIVRVKRLKSNSGALGALLVNNDPLRVDGTGYVASSAFNADVLLYNITLQSTNPKLTNPKMPNIEAIAGAVGQTISIEQNGINATSYIVVTPEDGSVENERSYELNIVVEKSNNTDLSNILVNGKPIVGFRPDSLEYEVTVPRDGSTPAVTYSATDQFQTVTPIISSEEARLNVKAENGAEKTYVVHFAVPPISNDATLADLKVDGTTINGFAPDVLNYSVLLPQGSLVVPSVEAFKSHDGQTIIIEKNGIGDTTLITVTAEDGITQQVYAIAFDAEKSHNADLEGISVNYVPIADFDANVLRYHVILPTNMQPTVIGIKAESVQRIDKTIYGNDSVSLKVTAEDGLNTKTYVVTFEVQAASNAYLGGLLLDETSIEGFRPDSLNYVVTLPAGTTVTPEVTAISGSDGQNIIICNNGVRDTTTIMVTAQDGITTLTYTIFFDVALSDIDTLAMIYLDGSQLENFHSQVLSYNITLPVGTRTYPTITWEKGERMEFVKLDTIERTTYAASFAINVESEKFHATGEGNSRTYTLNFTVEKSAVDTLAMIYIKGDSLDNFRGDTLIYNIELPVGTRLLPTVDYTLADNFQTVVVDSVDTDLTDYAAQINIEVTAENESLKVYELHFTVAKSAVDTLKNITINGLSIALNGDNYTSDKAFAGSTFEYHLLWAIGSAKNPLPQIDYEMGDTLQTVAPELVEMKSYNDTTIIVVTAENGNSNTYTIYHQLQHSEVDTLAMIYVNDEPLANFHADTLTYNLTLPVGTRKLPKVEFDKGDVWQTAKLDTVLAETYASKLEIHVTAESGKQRTYTLNFVVEKSAVDTLVMITLDGKPLEGFAPNIFSYNYTLPIGTDTLPTIAYEMGDTLQTVSVVNNGVNGSYQIIVTAENGTQTIYTINFTVAKSTNAYLKNLFYDGTAIENFDPELFMYTIKLPFDTAAVAVPEISAEKGEENQTVQITQAATIADTAVVTVTAEDGVTVVVYKVAFEMLQSDNALLEMIFLNGEEMNKAAKGFTVNDDFDAETFEYTIGFPYGTQQLPEITWKGQLPNQYYTTIDSLVVNPKDSTAIITVVSENGEVTNEYHLKFYVGMSDNCKLNDLYFEGVQYPPFEPTFHSDSTEYVLKFEVGTKIEELPKLEHVRYVKGDEVQTVNVTYEQLLKDTAYTTAGDYTLAFNGVLVANNERIDKQAGETVTLNAGDTLFTKVNVPNPFKIFVSVTAQNGVTRRIYVVDMQILKSEFSLLDGITINGVALKGFEPEVFEYTYLVPMGITTVPLVEGIVDMEKHPLSPREVFVTMGNLGDTTYIYCEAEDKIHQSIYKIVFESSTINQGDAPTKEDVHWTVLGNGFFKATTCRNNVKIAIFDTAGRLITMQDVPVVDPNDDIRDSGAAGVTFHFERKGRIFIYVFYYGTKKVITSEKFIY